MRHAGSLYLILVGLMLCAVGAAFTWLMWRSFERAAEQRDWTEVPCRILDARIEQRRIADGLAAEYSFAVLYGYRVGEQRYTSERYSLRGASWSKEEERAKKLLEKFPAGTERRAFVDPSDPGSAVLKLDSKGPGYSLWFPILIVVGGLGIIAGAVRSMVRARPPTESDNGA